MDMKVLVWALCWLLMAVALGSNESCNLHTVRSQFLEDLARGYDKRRRPNATGAPVKVEVQIYMTSLVEINEKEQKLGIAGYFRTWWHDPRLAFQSKENAGCQDKFLDLTEAEKSTFWHPDLYFVNVLEETYGADLFQLDENGSIWSSVRVSHLYACRMDFQDLPFDQQRCTIEIASYSLDTTKINLLAKEGKEGPVGLRTPEAYRPNSTAWEVKEVTSQTKVMMDFTGKSFTLVCLEVVLRRNPDYWIWGSGMKALLFVFITWCGFFVNRTMAPARVNIAVIPVLIMINLITAAEGHLPHISYSTTLNDYLLTCLVFSSTGVFEYALVAYFLQKEVWYAEKYALLLKIGNSSLRKKEPPAPEDSAPMNMVLKDDIGEGYEEPPDTSGTETEPPPNLPQARRKAKRRKTPKGRSLDHGGSMRIFNEHPVITAIFKEFDRERNGRYSVSEIRRALKGFGQYRSHREVREMFSMIGVAPGEDMSLGQFEQFLADPEAYVPVLSTSRSFWDMPPSLQTDIAMRVAYPIIWASISAGHLVLVFT